MPSITQKEPLICLDWVSSEEKHDLAVKKETFDRVCGVQRRVPSLQFMNGMTSLLFTVTTLVTKVFPTRW